MNAFKLHLLIKNDEGLSIQKKKNPEEKVAYFANLLAAICYGLLR